MKYALLSDVYVDTAVTKEKKYLCFHNIYLLKGKGK